MSCWWYCESRDAYYNLSTISKIKFKYDGNYKIELFKNNEAVAFFFEYESDERATYKKEKREIMKLIGMFDD
jgi:hypothetical protein